MSGRAENPNGETRRRFFWNAAGRSVDVPGRRDRGSNIFLRFVKEWTPNTYTRKSIMEAQHAQKAQGGWSVNQQQAPTLAIILLSKDLERLHAGSLVGSVAAMSGMSVRLFVTMNALEAFLKENVEKRAFQTGTVGAEMLSKNIPLFCDLLREGKENGDLRLYACSMAMDVMGWKREDLIDLFDDVIGVSSFLGMSQGAQVITM